MRAILLVDHGSVRAEANAMLECVANLLATMVGSGVIVRAAHMELAEPGVAEGVAACVSAGATEIAVFPYMLSPGKHSTRDIPRMAAAAAAAHPHVRVTVMTAFGVHAKLAEVIAERAGVALVRDAEAIDRAQCWNPRAAAGTCGDACCVHTARDAARASTLAH